MRTLLPSVALLLAGCWPHHTRPLKEPESKLVDEMCARIGKRVQPGSPSEAVWKAIEAARRDGRIAVFEDEPVLDGRAWHGAVSWGRLYLHSTLLDGTEDASYARMILFHEGVHLTQSTCALIFTPGACEEEARKLAGH